MKTIGKPAVTIPKIRKEYTDDDRKAIEKNFRAKNTLICGIGPDEYNKIFACQSAKEIWEALQTAKDLQKLTIDEPIGNLKTYEIKKRKDLERREPKKEKNLVLKADNNDSSGKDADMVYLTKRFQKMVRRNGGLPKRGSSSRPKGYDLCHKCGKPGHFIKDCPLHKKDQHKHNTDKAVKRNPIPVRIFMRKDATDNIVKQALAAWGDSSSESEGVDEQGDISMMAVESESTEYDSIFALMEKSDDDDDKVNFLDVQRNLKSYSQKKLISLANVLIDTNYNLINDKNVLTVGLREVEHERGNLVAVVVNLKETIETLKKEKDALTEKIANVHHERDDLLVVVVDLKETSEELKRERRHENTQKGKEVASEAHLRLENELKSVKSSLCTKLERNRQFQEDLGRIKNLLSGPGPLMQSLICIRTIGETGRESGFKGKRLLTTLIAGTLLFLITGFALSVGEVKRSSQRWYMDSGCSKHMNGSTNDFLSLKALQGGSPLQWQKGYIPGVGRIGKTLTHSIENVYYVNNLQYSLLGISQIYDKGNKVEFVLKICTFTNLVTGEMVLMAKRYKNIYVTNFESLHNGDLTCQSVVDDDAELWHRRLGHASFTILNKLVKKDLVRGLPKSSFKDHKVCDACVKRKQVRSPFKPKKEVSTSSPLDILHMDLCGPMRVPSRGGKKYIFVIMDDYSRFTWTLFLRTKDETFPVFATFVKKIQVNMSHNVVSIRSDHGTEFDTAKFDEFCAENGISHNFSAPRTPQQNGVVEKKIVLLKIWRQF
ncbi:uncharacterized protein [Nicotiana sylvestris]|uniref:uncharacterized protein n=1 Tax=Nicotiana sylvestris TaxID=4096 RepID=UPI00388C404A